MPNMQVAWNVVFTGLIVVFIVLIFLVYLVQGYGSAIRKLQEKAQRQKRREEEIVSISELAAQPVPYVEEGIPGEVVAAISAAVYCLYGETAHSVASVRRASAGSSAWQMAGLLENTRPF